MWNINSFNCLWFSVYGHIATMELQYVMLFIYFFGPIFNIVKCKMLREKEF